MKELSIYIDYGGEKEGDFSEKLQAQLKNIKGINNVLIYRDIQPENGVDWESNTLSAVKSADIVITLLSENYLSFVNESLTKEFEKIIDSDNRFLFPILYKASEWGSFSWVVRSKLIPLDGIPLTDHTDNDVDKVINDLIKTIKNILLKTVSDGKSTKTNIRKTIAENNKIVFISHDHDDADFAELLKLKLEKDGLNGWIDSERLKIGQDWREEIDLGIENSVALIAIMTPDAKKSEYVTYEWAFAWGKGKKIFPIMLKQTQLHPRLESLQYLDFTNRASRPWNDLIASIKDLL